MITPDDTPHSRFTNDASKRATLLALLSDPILQEAMDIADDMLRPKSGTAADANQPLSIAKFHQSAGANEFVKILRGMTKVPQEPVKLQPRRLAKSVDDLPDNLKQ